jgi:hypothetical protein
LLRSRFLASTVTLQRLSITLAVRRVVCPVYCRCGSERITRQPEVGIFGVKVDEKDPTRLGDNALPEQRLDEIFDLWWPKLEERLKATLPRWLP